MMKFYRTVADKQAMMKLKGSVFPCIGMYEGVMEFSWIAAETDFSNYLVQFTTNQKTLLRVVTDGGGTMLASLLDNKTRNIVEKGRLKSVDTSTALRYNNFTYRPDLDIYWVMT
jgi:hypothetical protein